jgi:hypothetical protein
MSLLDDLQSQVAEKKANELALLEEQQAQEEFYALKLRPAMIQAREYFDEVVTNLKVIGPDIQCKYPLDPESMAGITFRQSDYEFFYDEASNPRLLDISCICRLKRAAEFYVPTKEKVEKYAELLNSYGLSFHQKNRLDDHYNIRGATFFLDEVLPAKISIQSHPADRCVYVYLQNFEKEPLKRYSFNPEQLTIELLEKIARILLREETELVKVTVSDHFREQLQQQVRSERLKKEQEVAQGSAYLDSLKRAEEEARLVSRAKNALLTRTKQMETLISRVIKPR